MRWFLRVQVITLIDFCWLSLALSKFWLEHESRWNLRIFCRWSQHCCKGKISFLISSLVYFWQFSDSCCFSTYLCTGVHLFSINVIKYELTLDLFQLSAKMRFAFWPPVYACLTDFGLKSEDQQTNVLLGPQLALAVKNNWCTYLNRM